jgi:hypothetical protein
MKLCDSRKHFIPNLSKPVTAAYSGETENTNFEFFGLTYKRRTKYWSFLHHKGPTVQIFWWGLIPLEYFIFLSNGKQIPYNCLFSREQTLAFIYATKFRNGYLCDTI